MNSLIIVDTKEKSPILKLLRVSDSEAKSEVLLSTKVFIGRNDATSFKSEGDGNTRVTIN